ncbi:MAG TPA: hypothetical protein ENJ42_05015, partial [Hellea balneolensis]|nr:hypothetical protein [Hellea balneolensis]
MTSLRFWALGVLLVALWGLSGCTPKKPTSRIVIYPAKSVVTMDATGTTARAVAVSGSKILKVGSPQDLQKQFTGARIDDRFKDDVIIPGLIDPHVHMILGAMMYSNPFAPPWDVQTPSGIVKCLPDRASFLKRIAEINAEHPGNQPLVIYG